MDWLTQKRERLADFGVIIALLLLLVLDVQASMLNVGAVGYAFLSFTGYEPLRMRRGWSIPASLCCLAIGGASHLYSDPAVLLRAALAMTFVLALIVEWSQTLKRVRATRHQLAQLHDLSTRQLLGDASQDSSSERSGILDASIGATPLATEDSELQTDQFDPRDSEDSSQPSSVVDGVSFEPRPSRSSLETCERLEATRAFSQATLDGIRAIALKERQVDMHLAKCRAEGFLSKFQLDCIRGGRERDLRVGRYTVESVIGRGAMGVVYLALDRARGRQVALKMYRNPGDHLARIRREMAVLEKLAHPNIVVALEVGQSSGRHFIAMEYVEGETLHQCVKRSGPLAPDVGIASHLAGRRRAGASSCARDSPS